MCKRAHQVSGSLGDRVAGCGRGQYRQGGLGSRSRGGRSTGLVRGNRRQRRRDLQARSAAGGPRRRQLQRLRPPDSAATAPSPGWNFAQDRRRRRHADGQGRRGPVGRHVYAPVRSRASAARAARSQVRRVERKSPTLGKQPPQGAIVLLDGKDFSELRLANGAELDPPSSSPGKDGSIQVPRAG